LCDSFWLVLGTLASRKQWGNDIAIVDWRLVCGGLLACRCGNYFQCSGNIRAGPMALDAGTIACYQLDFGSLRLLEQYADAGTGDAVGLYTGIAGRFIFMGLAFKLPTLHSHGHHRIRGLIFCALLGNRREKMYGLSEPYGWGKTVFIVGHCGSI
jgi:hypothetical protein